jgi:cytochrome c-type biogenesis protein CcmE
LSLSFACPKESNQRKRQPQSIFGIIIFSVAHALQLVRYALSNSNAYLFPPLRNLKNANLFPKMLWWRSSPYGD